MISKNTNIILFYMEKTKNKKIKKITKKIKKKNKEMDSTNIYESIVNMNKNHKLIPSPYYASIEDAIEKITNNIIGKGNHILLSTGSATPTYYYYVLYQAENEEYYIIYNNILSDNKIVLGKMVKNSENEYKFHPR